MNNHNKQQFYKPPKVKPSKKLQQTPLPEWNSYNSDLSRYKLTQAEIVFFFFNKLAQKKSQFYF